ncbi:hypothetical protein [Streptomyces olivochromogenes]|uniref:DUF3168 domain-containing protein n=1 Tax=Streptomyces olivochromogenes TaxID=1963 RepID=A0A250VKJ9_STROL|nr:hypothetical protein [Streptomyces olivochromogenes]GAX54743.1 hypothetical protein SO3561_06296 [Streptomyces olivochromogenes]
MANQFAQAESVAVAWLKSLGLTAVATEVPEDSGSWWSTGFVQVEKTGSVINPHVKLRNNVITCHIWAARQDRNKQNAPYGQANQIGELIVDACFNESYQHWDTVLSASLGSIPVRVINVSLLQDPTKVPSDDAHMAHYVMDIQITWVQKDS